MRVAVYGGSFNPPHAAHAMVVRWLLEAGLVDQVWLVPVFRHAFEGIHAKRLAPFEDRVRWCQALADEVGPEVRVRAVEADLPVPSFTIDTLDHLSERHPDARLRLVVGADVLAQVDSWRDWAGIEARFAPIVVGREGHPVPEGVPVFPDVSSTEVRRRLAEGESVAGLVTPAVEALLADHSPWCA